VWISIQGVTRDIGEDSAMGGDMDDSEKGVPQARNGAWPDAVIELMGAFTQVNGPAFDAEVAAGLMDGPPWQSVSPGELAGLMAAYHQARAVTEELRDALAAAGLPGEEFPELSGCVDGHGRAVIRIGTVSASSATRLARVLRAAPKPPATRGKAA
jgi:hypothetical protein